MKIFYYDELFYLLFSDTVFVGEKLHYVRKVYYYYYQLVIQLIKFVFVCQTRATQQNQNTKTKFIPIISSFIRSFNEDNLAAPLRFLSSFPSILRFFFLFSILIKLDKINYPIVGMSSRKERHRAIACFVLSLSLSLLFSLFIYFFLCLLQDSVLKENYIIVVVCVVFLILVFKSILTEILYFIRTDRSINNIRSILCGNV